LNGRDRGSFKFLKAKSSLFIHPLLKQTLARAAGGAGSRSSKGRFEAEGVGAGFDVNSIERRGAWLTIVGADAVRLPCGRRQGSRVQIEGRTRIVGPGVERHAPAQRLNPTVIY